MTKYMVTKVIEVEAETIEEAIINASKNGKTISLSASVPRTMIPGQPQFGPVPPPPPAKI